MRNKLGTLFMILGAALVLGALALLLYNRLDARRAAAAADAALPQLLEQIEHASDTSERGIEYVPSTQQNNATEHYSISMPEAEIDGYRYIGVLVIPSLSLELPVMSEWDYERLRIAPCRYSGSIPARNLVIAGHNYQGHFGTLYQLSAGDELCFFDMNGERYNYAVDAIETLAPTSVDEMTAGDYPLTLFTCTVGGQTRLAVRCVSTDPLPYDPSSW